MKRILLSVLTLCLLAPLAQAQTVDELIAKYQTARGGAKWTAAKSMKMTGKMSMGPGMEAPFTIQAMRPDYFRLDFTVQGLTGTQAYDGKNGWMSMPFMGKKDPEPMPDDMVKELAEQADFDGSLIDYKKKGHTVELLGKEAVEGADAYKIKVTKKSGSIETIYLDAETYLPIKSEGKVKVRGQEVESESSMSDYKDVGNGIIVAYSMEQGQKGSPQKNTMTIDKVEIDTAMKTSDFVMPAKADSSGGGKADSTAAKAAPAQAAPAKSDAKTATKPATTGTKK